MQACTGTIKNVNEGLIVKELLNGELVTKQILAKKTELSFPTVSKIIDEFVESKLVVSLGLEKTSPGGRRAELYKFNENSAFGLSLYLQEKKIWFLITDAIGKVIMNSEYEVREEGYVESIRRIIQIEIKKNALIKAISIGVPGGVSKGVICYIDKYDELRNCKLKELLEKEFQIPVAVENNMRTVTYGLGTKKNSKCRESVVCLHIANNGPGCGVLINGKTVSGFNGFAGEVGYLPMFDTKNLQQIALDGFKDIDTIDYFARLIAGVCVFYNPEEIIFYENDKYTDKMDAIINRCRKYIPDIALPRIEISTKYWEDYQVGLIEMIKDILYPAYSIVRE